MSQTGLCLEDLTVGRVSERLHTVEEGDLVAFAAVSGDRNPVHLDEAYAANTAFKGRIAHGMLSAAYISAVLGMDLPGPGSIYLSQTLSFKRPVRIGDTVLTRATVVAIDGLKARVTLKTECLVAGKAVVDGEAVVMVPRRAVAAPPAAAAPSIAEAV
jgi:3-hydroxybutyryl-CoA dehydratase